MFNRFQEFIVNPPSNVEEKLNFITTTLHNSGLEILGRKDPRKPRWMPETTWDLIEQRRSLKNRRDSAKTIVQRQDLAIQYNELDRRVKRSAKRDKTQALYSKIKLAEDAVRHHNVRPLYKIAKEISGRPFTSSGSVKDKNGNRLTSQNEILNRWRQHFTEVLNAPPPDSIVDIDEVVSALNIPHCEEFYDEPPTAHEIEVAIKKMKNG